MVLARISELLATSAVKVPIGSPLASSNDEILRSQNVCVRRLNPVNSVDRFRTRQMECVAGEGARPRDAHWFGSGDRVKSGGNGEVPEGGVQAIGDQVRAAGSRPGDIGVDGLDADGVVLSVEHRADRRNVPGGGAYVGYPSSEVTRISWLVLPNTSVVFVTSASIVPT